MSSSASRNGREAEGGRAGGKGEGDGFVKVGAGVAC